MTALAGLLLATPACAQSPATVKTAAASDPAATIGGRTITIEEIDRKWQELDAASYMKTTQEMFDIRRRVIDVMVGDHVLGDAAKARGLTTEALLAEELPKRVGEITEADLQTTYDQMRSQMGGRTLDEVRVALAQFLMQQRQTEARQALVTELRAKATGIEVLLEPPRYTIVSADHEPVRGPASAPVEIVEFSDFQCPYCSRVNPTLDRLRQTFGDDIKIVFRDFPLTSIHPQAFKAAEAGQCAREQGKFWEYHDRMFANQQALQPEFLKKYAADAGLAAAAFNTCLDSARHAERVKSQIGEGTGLGVSSTPSVFINGRMLSGAQSYEAFASIIDDELARAR